LKFPQSASAACFIYHFVRNGRVAAEEEVAAAAEVANDTQLNDAGHNPYAEDNRSMPAAHQPEKALTQKIFF
jgi:hypothetical protein